MLNQYHAVLLHTINLATTHLMAMDPLMEDLPMVDPMVALTMGTTMAGATAATPVLLAEEATAEVTTVGQATEVLVVVAAVVVEDHPTAVQAPPSNPNLGLQSRMPMPTSH